MNEYVPQWISPLFSSESKKLANPLSLQSACKYAMAECGPEVNSCERAREAWMLLPNVLEFIAMIPNIGTESDAESEYRRHIKHGITFETIARYTREFAGVKFEWDNATQGWYSDYLLSDHWKNIRKEAHRIFKGECRTCCRTENLEVHHRHYQTLGREDAERDLILLCADCHHMIHQAHDIRPPREKPAWLQ